MPFGYFDTTFIDTPPNVDAAYIAALATRDGVSFEQVLQEIDGMLGQLNGGVDPLVASLLQPPTTDPTVDTTSVAAFDIEEATEYTIARPQVQEGLGIMVPFRKYDVSLGFTEDGLRQATRAKILQQVRGVVSGMELVQRRAVLRRLFSIAEVRVDRRTTYKAPGFAGSGTGDNVFTGSYPDGTPLAGGYTHYARTAAADLAAAIATGRDALKRFYPGPYHLIGPVAQIAAVEALAAFVPATSALITVGSGTAVATVDIAQYVGVYDGDILVHQPLYDFTSANLAIYKSFGAFAGGNPLIWRYDEIEGRSAYLRMRQLFPLDQAVLKQGFGIGVANRLAAYLISVAASGAYTDPTIG